MTDHNAELLACARVLLVRLDHQWWKRALADSPEDMAQDIALRALERLDRFDPARFTRAGDPFECWLRLVARTVALNARRERVSASRRPQHAHQFTDLGGRRDSGEWVRDHRIEDADPRQWDRDERRLARVVSAVDKLAQRQRRAVMRRYGLDGGGERSFPQIDPTRNVRTNRGALVTGLANVRRLLGVR